MPAPVPQPLGAEPLDDRLEALRALDMRHVRQVTKAKLVVEQQRHGEVP